MLVETPRRVCWSCWYLPQLWEWMDAGASTGWGWLSTAWALVKTRLWVGFWGLDALYPHLCLTEGCLAWSSMLPRAVMQTLGPSSTFLFPQQGLLPMLLTSQPILFPSFNSKGFS